MEVGLKEAGSLGVATAVIIDGSYVTIKEKPSDIDMIVILRQNVARKQELMPAEYNAESRRMVKRQYGFDVLAAGPDSLRYADRLKFFLRVRPNDPEMRTNRKTKGVLRIEL